MEPSAFSDQRLVGSPAVSPDGERVAFLATEFDAAADERHASLFVVPADGHERPHRLTRASDAGTPRWSPDGRYLGFVATRETDRELAVDADSADADEDEDGDDDPDAQVWAFDIERGGDARQLTDRDHGVSAFDWGPEGERLVIAARDPTDEEETYLDDLDESGPIEIERLQHKYDGRGWLDSVASYLFVVDVDTRETSRLDDATDRGYGGAGAGLQPAWGTERIAFVASDAPNPDDTAVTDLFTISPDGSERRKHTAGDLVVAEPGWNPAGERLAFAASDPENFYRPTELHVTDLDGSHRTVSGTLDRTLAATARCWLDETTLLAGIGDRGRTRLARFDVDADPERVFEVQSESETIVSGGLAVDGGTVAGVFSRYDDGRDLYSFAVADLGADDDPRTRLTTSNEALLAEFDRPGCRRFTFESADGTEIEAFAYHPPDFDPDDPDPHPLLVKIHGGPMAYDAPGWGFDETFWTNAGYVVLEVNYRGSTSYGAAFCEELRGVWNSVEVADLDAGVDAAVERGWADPDRLFCTGFSQGGINTGYLVTKTDRFAAAAAEHGIYDLQSSFGTDDSQVWLDADNGVPWENAEAYRDSSSLPDVGAVDTPTLLTAGEHDWRCPPTQSEQFYVSLRKAGVESKLVVYQDEHHAIGTPDRAVHRLTELHEWFAAHDPAA